MQTFILSCPKVYGNHKNASRYVYKFYYRNLTVTLKLQIASEKTVDIIILTKRKNDKN